MNVHLKHYCQPTTLYAAKLEGAAVWVYTINHGCTAFPKIQKPPQNSGHQKDDIKHVLYWVPQMLAANTKEFVVTTKTWHPGFLHPCCKTAFNYEVRNMKKTDCKQWNSVKAFILLYSSMSLYIAFQQLGKEAALSL